jgi:hypothetical protein
MKKFIVFVLFLVVFISCGGGSKLDKLDTWSAKEKFLATSSNSSHFSEIEFVSSLGLHGSALDINIPDGDFAYIASGDYGLQVIDISDPYDPRLVKVYDTYGYVNHVEVIDDIAYVSFVAKTWDDYESVNAFDISDPYSAEYLGYYEGYSSNDHQYIEVDDGYIYISNQSIYTSSFDGKYQDSYQLFTPNAFGVSNGYIYVANGTGGLTILKTKDGFTGSLAK